MAIRTIGIVGCGAIGKALLKAVEAGRLAKRIDELLAGRDDGEASVNALRELLLDIGQIRGCRVNNDIGLGL